MYLPHTVTQSTALSVELFVFFTSLHVTLILSFSKALLSNEQMVHW